MTDWASDPRTARWLSHVRHQVLPMIHQSAITLVISPDEPDVKVAVELGLSILLNKPIIVVVPPGRVPPPGLARIAHEVVVAEPGPAGAAAVAAAMARITGEEPP